MSATGASADVVLDFLRSKHPDLQTIDPDLDLIETRLLDSLHFVEFLYLLEEATGREIALEEVTPDDFRTARRIRARFLGG